MKQKILKTHLCRLNIKLEILILIIKLNLNHKNITPHILASGHAYQSKTHSPNYIYLEMKHWFNFLLLLYFILKTIKKYIHVGVILTRKTNLLLLFGYKVFFLWLHNHIVYQEKRTFFMFLFSFYLYTNIETLKNTYY